MSPSPFLTFVPRHTLESLGDKIIDAFHFQLDAIKFEGQRPKILHRRKEKTDGLVIGD